MKIWQRDVYKRQGRGFAQAGGVAAAVEEIIRREHPDFEVKTQRADGLRECRKLLMLAKAGKFDGYLLLSLIHISPLTTHYVPKDSIVREFVGGSIFKY